MAEPASSSGPGLTFGVEFELVCRYIRDEKLMTTACSETLEPWRAFIEGEIIKAFRAEGLAIRDNDGPFQGPMSHDMWVVDDDLSIDDRDPHDATSWGWEGCTHSFLGLELKTPVLTYGAADLRQVRTGLEILNDKLGSGIQVLVNRSCGLHVHIGRQQDGFPLRTLHFVAGLATVFEATIHNMHPAYRLTSKYCMPLSRSDRLSAEPTAEGRVEVLLQTQTVRDFIKAANGGSKHYAYNFLHLLPLAGHLQVLSPHFKPYNTIEFRQHEGTTDPSRVLHWIHFCAALVTFAHNAPSPDWVEVVVKWGFRPTAVSVRLLLTKIATPYHTALFYSRRQNPVGLPDMPVCPPMPPSYRGDRNGLQRMRLWRDRLPPLIQGPRAAAAAADPNPPTPPRISTPPFELDPIPEETEPAAEPDVDMTDVEEDVDAEYELDDGDEDSNPDPDRD
ncbi:MAG: hypothetical protein M1826_004389 [Phylliscum demangeonii]|nr:MAG: hypothetical protein M1826_004389 [Phylliscum demangeonii]